MLIDVDLYIYVMLLQKFIFVKKSKKIIIGKNFPLKLITIQPNKSVVYLTSKTQHKCLFLKLNNKGKNIYCR